MSLPIPDDYKAGFIFPTNQPKTLEERIEGLPKWAQKLIADLRAQKLIADLRSDLTDAKLNSRF